MQSIRSLFIQPSLSNHISHFKVLWCSKNENNKENFFRLPRNCILGPSWLRHLVSTFCGPCEWWTYWQLFVATIFFLAAIFCGRHWPLKVFRVKEPLDREHGSRLDCIKVFLFRGGRSLVWDCTCVDTFTRVHLNTWAMEAGTAATAPRSVSAEKNSAFAETHQFELIAVETMGVYGGSTLESFWRQ